MSPRPNVSDERKAQILNASEIVFAQKGLNDARMDDIAQETGVSKGVLYLYFKSKDDLIIAILDRVFQRQFKDAESLVGSDHSAEKSIRQFAEFVIRDIAAIVRLTPIAYELLALAFRNKYVKKSLKMYFSRYMDVLVPLIQRGIDSGEFRAVNAQDMAITAGAIFEGTILLWVYDKSQVDVAKNIRAGIGFLIEGIKA
jgi:TetR/AcrR family fatty acid metabolism transcriptional regulator